MSDMVDNIRRTENWLRSKGYLEALAEIDNRNYLTHEIVVAWAVFSLVTKACGKGDKDLEDWERDMLDYFDNAKVRDVVVFLGMVISDIEEEIEDAREKVFINGRLF